MSELNYQPVKMVNTYELETIEEVNEDEYGCECGMSINECTCWSSMLPDVSDYCFGCGSEMKNCDCSMVPKMFVDGHDEETISYYTENSNISEIGDCPENWENEETEDEVVNLAGMPEIAE